MHVSLKVAIKSSGSISLLPEAFVDRHLVSIKVLYRIYCDEQPSDDHDPTTTAREKNNLYQPKKVEQSSDSILMSVFDPTEL